MAPLSGGDAEHQSSSIANEETLLASSGGPGVTVGLGDAGAGGTGAGPAVIVGAEVAAAVTELVEGGTEAVGAGAWHALRRNRRTMARRTGPC